MHHKFIVIGYDKIGLGSWNFDYLSEASDKIGADDFNFFRHTELLVELYLLEFRKLYRFCLK